MTEVVLLSDIYSENLDGIANSEKDKWSFWSRYLAPYVIKEAIVRKTNLNDIKVIDYFTKIENFFSYMENFLNEDTKYIGISTTFLKNPHSPRVNDFNLWFSKQENLYEWFDKLSKLAPNAKIILGGYQTNIWFDNYVKKNNGPLPTAMSKFVDCVIDGYGEKAIAYYINNTIPENAKFYKDNVLFISLGTKAGDKETDLLSVTWQSTDSIQKNEWLPLEISKGCRFGCKFCMFDKQGTTIKEEESLRNEFINNYNMWNTTGYLLTDDTLNDSMKKVEMLHNVISNLPFKIEFISYIRPDMFYKFPQMLPLLIDIGCKGMFLGIETFNPTAAKIAGKGLHPEKIKDILVWLKEECNDNIFILTSFIIGLVGETEESLDETLAYLTGQKIIDKILWEVLYVRSTGNSTAKDEDFNSKPTMFGFKKISYNPYYWEHETLNYTQCRQISEKWRDTLKNHTFSKPEIALETVGNFWSYPRLRSIGYTHEKSVTILKGDSVPQTVYKKNKQWINNYHKNLIY